MTVRADGSYDINLPDGPFEMIDAVRTIYDALLNYVIDINSQKRMTFLLSEHLAHQDFLDKLIKRTLNNEILHKHPILQ